MDCVHWSEDFMHATLTSGFWTITRSPGNNLSEMQYNVVSASAQFDRFSIRGLHSLPHDEIAAQSSPRVNYRWISTRLRYTTSRVDSENVINIETYLYFRKINILLEMILKPCNATTRWPKGQLSHQKSEIYTATAWPSMAHGCLIPYQSIWET